MRKRIFKTRLFELWGTPRKTPNEFTELGDAVEAFKMSVFKAWKIDKIVDWISRMLNKNKSDG